MSARVKLMLAGLAGVLVWIIASPIDDVAALGALAWWKRRRDRR